VHPGSWPRLCRINPACFTHMGEAEKIWCESETILPKKRAARPHLRARASAHLGLDFLSDTSLGGAK
jgi:hypothetical protein